MKPLNGGSAAIASEPIKNKSCRLRHALNESAQLFHIARMRRVQNRARAHEQETLERRVIERVIERCDKCQRRQARIDCDA